jgi:uncharacterized protein (TIGR03435 family)
MLDCWKLARTVIGSIKIAAGRSFRWRCTRGACGCGLAALLAVSGHAGSAWAQSSAAGASGERGGLAFEVASVKENRSGSESRSNIPLDSGNAYTTVGDGDARLPNGDYFSAVNEPLMRYIVFAYQLSGTQELALRFNLFAGLKANVPAWVNRTGFDIEARAEGRPTKDQMRMMMRELLRERFGLVAHYEMRQAPVFGLVLARPGKMGPQLRPHVADSCTGGGAAASGFKDAMPGVCGVIAHVAPSVAGRTAFGALGVTLQLLATSLPTQTGMMTVPRPVVDRTGLEGTFDLRLEWALDTGRRPEAGQEVQGPTFQEALRGQLGLKLVPEKSDVELLVIDHVERPSEN